MLAQNNILLFLMAVLPAIIYAFILYYCIPKNMVSISRSRRYLVTGFLSVMLIHLFYFLFPEWGERQSDNVFIAYFVFAFIQVGLLEEFTKYLTFQWVSSERHSEKNDLPIAIMFYSMMSAAGFAMVENVSYLINLRDELINKVYGYLSQGVTMDPFQIQSFLTSEMTSMAFVRAYSAVVMHMICGLIMGYFLWKSHEEKYSIRITKDEEFITDQPEFKRWYYIGCGILSAALIHGAYDMNLMLPNNEWVDYFCYVNLFTGLIISGFIIKTLIRKSKEIRKANPLKKVENETDQ